MFFNWFVCSAVFCICGLVVLSGWCCGSFRLCLFFGSNVIRVFGVMSALFLVKEFVAIDGECFII